MKEIHVPHETGEALNEPVFVRTAWKVSKGADKYVGFLEKSLGTRHYMCRLLIGQFWCLCWILDGGDVCLGLLR